MSFPTLVEILKKKVAHQLSTMVDEHLMVISHIPYKECVKLQPKNYKEGLWLIPDVLNLQLSVINLAQVHSF